LLKRKFIIFVLVSISVHENITAVTIPAHGCPEPFKKPKNLKSDHFRFFTFQVQIYKFIGIYWSCYYFVMFKGLIKV